MMSTRIQISFWKDGNGYGRVSCSKAIFLSHEAIRLTQLFLICLRNAVSGEKLAIPWLPKLTLMEDGEFISISKAQTRRLGQLIDQSNSEDILDLWMQSDQCEYFYRDEPEMEFWIAEEFVENLAALIWESDRVIFYASSRFAEEDLSHFEEVDFESRPQNGLTFAAEGYVRFIKARSRIRS